jgi:hypothetical protein
MPDGTVVRDVPANITQEELWDRYTASERGTSPIEKGFTKGEEDQALYQAQRQTEYEARQKQIAEFEAAHPEARVGSDVMRETPPAVEPYLEHRKPPLPPSPIQKFTTSYKMGNLENENRMRQVMARDLFPDMNRAEAMQRVGFFDGAPVYIDDKGDMQQLSSGRMKFAANMAANWPEMLATPLGPLGIAGAHGIKRGVASLIFNEPTTELQNLGGMAIEGGIGLAGDLPGRAINMAGGRGTFVHMTPAQLKGAEAVRQRIFDTTGIQTDIAQASGNRNLISARKYLARHPGESGQIFDDFDKQWLQQLHDAQDQVLDGIANAKPAEIAEAGGVNAADAALRSARREISAKVRPLYNKAYEKNTTITDPDLLSYLKLPYFPEAYAAGQRIARLEEREAGTTMTYTTKSTREKHPSGAFRVTKNEITEMPVSQPDLRSLDYLKQGLDGEIQKLKDAGAFKEAGALETQRNSFVDALDRLPSGEYQAARRLYKQLYDTRLAPLENGPVGVLAKLKDKDAVGAAAKIFGDGEVTDSQILLAKRAIQAENPQAWDDLTRTWLSDVFQKARTESQTGAELNPGGKSRQILFGNNKLRKKMHAILPPGSVQAFDDLMFASQKLSSTPIGGSNTPVDTEFKEILKGRALPVFKWLTTFRRQAIDTAERDAVEKGSKEMALAMTDPTKIKHIKRALRMRPSVQQAVLLSTIIAARTGAEAARSEYVKPKDSAMFAQ